MASYRLFNRKLGAQPIRQRMKQDILVLGAGIVGTCTALELALRGHRVTLLDRRAPGEETSYGNAGVIQREAVEPYAFPCDPYFMLQAALGRRLDVRLQITGLLAALPSLVLYWKASAPACYRRIRMQYATLIAHSTREHERYIHLAHAEELVRRDGFRFIYRSQCALDAALQKARRIEKESGLRLSALDRGELAKAEPGFQIPLAGGLHWLDSWSVSDPGRLVKEYTRLFLKNGGQFLSGEGRSLRQTRSGWAVDAATGRVDAAHAVIALGPWSDELTRRLGYRLPLFVKRGYHRHYAGGASVNVPMLDAERGYVLSRHGAGLRLTTGAELALPQAPPTIRQLSGAEAEARRLLALGTPVEETPWLGCRPCVADMKPVIGAAPNRCGLWFNFGHGHQGFTLGPASARLFADLFESRTPYVDAGPFSPARFGT